MTFSAQEWQIAAKFRHGPIISDPPNAGNGELSQTLAFNTLNIFVVAIRRLCFAREDHRLYIVRFRPFKEFRKILMPFAQNRETNLSNLVKRAVGPLNFAPKS